MPLVGTWRLSLIDRFQAVALDYTQVHLIPNTGAELKRETREG